MIVTLTPNPSLDLLFSADRLVWDDANRLPMPRRRAGGQGINVVRAARELGPVPAHAVAPLGGPIGRELRDMLEEEGTSLTPVPIAGETRVFVGVRESATGRALLLNPRGPEITEREAEALLDAVARVLEGRQTDPARGDIGPGGTRSEPPDWAGSSWLAVCGSLLPGLPPDFYARAGRLARRSGTLFVPDADGEALALAAPEADLLVPNDREAARLVGRPIEGPTAAAGAARELLDRGPARVVVTLGGEGAVAVDGSGAWWARPVPPRDRAAELERASAVGAGDAFLAGLLQAAVAGTAPEHALADAVAAGTAVLLSLGTDLVRRSDVEEVKDWIEIERVRPDRRR